MYSFICACEESLYLGILTHLSWFPGKCYRKEATSCAPWHVSGDGLQGKWLHICSSLLQLWLEFFKPEELEDFTYPLYYMDLINSDHFRNCNYAYISTDYFWHLDSLGLRWYICWKWLWHHSAASRMGKFPFSGSSLSVSPTPLI